MFKAFNRLNYRLVNRKNRIKRPISTNITYGIVVTIYSLLSVMYLYLLFWLVMACFKTHTELALHPWTLPEKWRWYNFVEMFEVFEYADTTMLGMIWNSVWHSLGGTFLNVFGTMSVAYLCAKYKFPGSRFYPVYHMALLIFPIYGSSGAGYRLVHALGFVNSPTILWTAWGVVGWNFFYFHGFFTSVSSSYAEAALIDGANDWVIFYKVILPQSFGIAGAIFITLWSSNWQDYSSQMLYMYDMPTLSVGIYYFKNEMVYRARMDILYCASLISSLPIFILYACFNNLLFKNVSMGGIKE